MSDKLNKYYKHYSTKNTYVNNIAAEHAFPTDLPQNKNACDYFGAPYINNCAYDGAGEMLKTIVPGDLKPRTMDWKSMGEISLFDQTEFINPLYVFNTSSLDQNGYVYIPNACRTKGSDCKVHVAIHGCHQGRETLDSQFVENTGYLEWAAANDIVVVFPQAKANDLNPKGCWDFWGYTGVDYASSLAVQTSTIKNMVERIITSPATAASASPSFFEAMFSQLILENPIVNVLFEGLYELMTNSLHQGL